MVFAGILAGGVGSRMGADRPKQFLEVSGVPVILRTLDAFCAVDDFEVIYLAVVSDWVDCASELIAGYSGLCGSDRRVRVIEGGSSRTDSLQHVMDAMRADGGSSGDILVSHDGVRPFVSERIIRENIAAAQQFGCAGTAMPCTDTILRAPDKLNVTEVPLRAELFRAQTPQSFRVGDYLECLANLPPDERDAVTDMCGVFTRAGRSVAIVTGDDRNIKITTPFDMLIAEAIIRNDG